MKVIRTPEELSADYLIDNSNAFDRDETVSLAKAAQEDLVTVGNKL